MRKSERRQLQAVLTETRNNQNGGAYRPLDKAVSHALMETVYMRCNQLHQRIVMALHEKGEAVSWLLQWKVKPLCIVERRD